MAFTWIAEMAFGNALSLSQEHHIDHSFHHIDTIVFIMTAWRTGTMYRESSGNGGHLYRLILRDGMYQGIAGLK